MTTLIPVSCWNVGIRVDKINWGLYFLTLRMTFHGCCTLLDASLASTRSFNSASMLSTPLIFFKSCSASSDLPLWMSELGLSSRNKDEIKITNAGTAAPPPAPTSRDLVSKEIDDISNQDPKSDGQLEEDVECIPVLVGSNLRQIKIGTD